MLAHFSLIASVRTMRTKYTNPMSLVLTATLLLAAGCAVPSALTPRILVSGVVVDQYGARVPNAPVVVTWTPASVFPAMPAPEKRELYANEHGAWTFSVRGVHGMFVRSVAFDGFRQEDGKDYTVRLVDSGQQLMTNCVLHLERMNGQEGSNNTSVFVNPRTGRRNRQGVRSDMMNEIERIQRWYRNQCDGDWEHASGVTIGTLDNPGWSLAVDLAGTDMESIFFEPMAYRVGPDSEPEDEDWYVCRIEESQFKGFGGPNHLSTLLKVFLDWAEQK
jgi:hypothetical protein